MRRIVLLAAVAALALVPSAQAAWVLRTTGIGPLKLGMGEKAAVKSGWLKPKRYKTSYSDNFQPKYPTYRIGGPGAPRGLRGEVLMGLNGSGRLAFIRVTHGATTEFGIRPQFDTLSDMRRVYRENGWKAVAQHEGITSLAPLEATPPGANSPTIAAQVISGSRIDVIGIPFVLWWP